MKSLIKKLGIRGMDKKAHKLKKESYFMYQEEYAIDNSLDLHKYTHDNILAYMGDLNELISTERSNRKHIMKKYRFEIDGVIYGE